MPGARGTAPPDTGRAGVRARPDAQLQGNGLLLSGCSLPAA